LAVQYKLFDEEKQELFAEMKVLREGAAKYTEFCEKFEKHLFWYKWLFLSKVKYIQEGKDFIEIAERAKFVEKDFFNREMARLSRMNGAAFAQVKDDLHDARQEIGDYAQ